MRSLLPSLLAPSPLTFNLSPALTPRVIGTLPNPSAHILAIWQSAPGAIQTPLLSAKPATTWQSGNLPLQPKYAAYYQTPFPPRRKSALRRRARVSAMPDPRCSRNRPGPWRFGLGFFAPLPPCTLNPSMFRRTTTRMVVGRRHSGATRPGSALSPSIPRSLDPWIPWLCRAFAHPPRAGTLHAMVLLLNAQQLQEKLETWHAPSRPPLRAMCRWLS
jgi:hypothetical protein